MSAPPTSQAFRDVIGRFASGVAVVTTRTPDGARHGTTASAVTSLSLDPPMVLVCMARSSATGRAVAEAGRFTLNVLGEDHADLAVAFARSGADKFSGVEVAPGPDDVPLLADALAHVSCTVAEAVEAATHVVFLGAVDHAEARPGAPLAYFRGRFGRLADQLVAAAHDGGPWPDLGPAASEALRDAYAAREAIELGAVDASVGRVAPEEVAELRELMEATRALVDGDRFTDVDAWIAANTAFHERIVALAGSDGLLRAYRALGLAGVTARALHAGHAATDALVRDHERLVEAYETSDAEAARAAIRDHVRRPAELASLERA